MQSISAIKHTPSVTYKDFVDSLTTRPQYFRFFLDKACGIAANIGIRYDDEKEDFALEAIVHLWRNLDKYDASKAEFSSFFNVCVGNKIREQIRSSNSDKVFGLNKTLRDDLEGCGGSLLYEEKDRARKNKEFTDKLIIEFRKFIDALSPGEQMMICGSEFGRLAVGDNTSDKNYADLIAARTGRTAAAVRKIAERLKKRAIASAGQSELDYGAYREYVEFLTTTPAEDKVDFSVLDWNSLSDVQRLKLRMYLYEKSLEDGLALDDIFGNDDAEGPKRDRAYEEGKLAAIETVTSILNRLKVAENNLTQSREEKDLISFTYWFVLIHEYNYLIRTIPMPQDVQIVFDEIDRFAPREYLEHKRRSGYNRLPDFHTVYGRGYNFPDIIGCTLSNRCAEEILSFIPNTEGMLVCGGTLKRQNLMLHFLQTGEKGPQLDYCDSCGKNLNDQPYPYSFRCTKCGRIFNLCKDCSDKRLHLNWGNVGRKPADSHEDAVNQQMFQGE